MGDISDGMCVRCGGEADDGMGGMCDKCRAIPAISVAKVRLAFLSEGIDVADPAIEGAQYDMLIRDPDMGWRSVQVKTAYNGWVNTCRPNSTGRKPYHKDRVDYIAVVDGYAIYLLPLSCCNNGGRMKMEDIRNDPKVRHHGAER